MPETRPPDEAVATLLEERVSWIAERIASSPIPVLPMGTTCTDVTGYARELLGRHGIHVLGGMELGIQAIGHALGWQAGRGRVRRWPAGLAAPAGRGGRLDRGPRP